MKLTGSHDFRIFLLALAAGAPALLACILLLGFGAYSARTQWTIGIAAALCWLGFAAAARSRVASSLRTLANLLEAMREGDYSIRGRVVRSGEPMADVMQQVNAMAATLRAQRLGALEATALLRNVMQEIDVAIFAFDPEQRLRLVNRAGERLLAQPAERLLARDAMSLGLAEYLIGEAERTVQRSFPGASGRWGIRRSQFREGGVPHRLLVVADLTRPLREEELLAWQRLVRVLGHELNNSLTPIKSIAQSLLALAQNGSQTEDMQEDVARGLQVIAARAESLNRFMGSYALLAKLPPPKFAPFEINTLLRHLAGLETRMHVGFEESSPVIVHGDPDQLQQALINLIRNAVDAAQETGGSVFIRLHRTASALQIIIRDEGPGLSNTANLFVPFFTTKRGGSGIGLVLSRQIAEAHNGSLVLSNAHGGPGCEAKLTLPI